jgi:hypothetical protein
VTSKHHLNQTEKSEKSQIYNISDQEKNNETTIKEKKQNEKMTNPSRVVISNMFG